METPLQDVQPMRSARVSAGYYVVIGTTNHVEITRVVYPHDGVYWVVTVDGRADMDPFLTKRAALQACQTNPSL